MGGKPRSVLVTFMGQITIEAQSQDEYVEKLDKWQSRLSEIFSGLDVTSEEPDDGEWWDDA